MSVCTHPASISDEHEHEHDSAQGPLGALTTSPQPVLASSTSTDGSTSGVVHWREEQEEEEDLSWEIRRDVWESSEFALSCGLLHLSPGMYVLSPLSVICLSFGFIPD